MSDIKGKMKKLFVFLVLVGAVAAGYYTGRQSAPPPAEQTDQAEPASSDGESAVKWWTCSMHPQIKLPEPGKCPICLMDLIPMTDEGGGEEGIPEISFSERARFLAEVETAPAERRMVTKTVRFVGKIQADETKLAMITAWVPGRLDRLFVDYTGMEVRKGDHLVELYSPELYSAQQELLQAISSFGEMKGAKSDLLMRTSESLIRSARDKLIRLGLTAEQVKEVIDRGYPTDTLTIYSPTSGIVTARAGTEGMYVKEGTMIYTIADLSTVWLMLDAYESDVEWLHYGQPVEFETEAFPGEKFAGTLSFISPVLDERSRTIPLRVNVPNDDYRLKPGMFARAVIHAVPSAGGKVIAPELADKWICPMHPEIIMDTSGTCPVCEMALETAESLGYVAAVEPEELPLVIPDTAPLITGKRAVVYVEDKRDDGIYYQGRIIELGPHADDYYIVNAGLEEGERVVTKGNFKIDSAIQIQAKPSMMNPAHDSTAKAEESEAVKEEYNPAEIPEEFTAKARPVLAAYLEIQQALAGDSFDKAKEAAKKLQRSVEELAENHLPGDHHTQWMEDVESLRNSSNEIHSAENIEKMREAFYPLSKSVETFVRHFGHDQDSPLRKAFCPMALEDGATWLQVEETVNNPYYGESMLRCCEIQATYPNRPDAKESKP